MCVILINLISLTQMRNEKVVHFVAHIF